MAGFGSIFMVFGYVISLIAGVWFVLSAFSESILWGLGCVLIPFVSLFFLIRHWEQAAKPFLLGLLGGALTIVGSLMAG